MRRTIFVFSALAALGVVAGAFAAPAPPNDPMAGYYGNTLLSFNQPLYMVRTWYYPDGSFKQFMVSHETGKLLLAGWEGTYTMQGSGNALKDCKTYGPGPAALPPPEPGCTAIAPHKVGDVWKMTYSTGPHKGTTETFTVAEGHNTEP